MYNLLVDILGEDNVIENEPMSLHTTFRIGGLAKLFATVYSEEELIKVIELLEENNEPYFILGNGSNILVGDKGYNGVIIQLAGAFDTVYIKDENIIAGSGAMLSVVARKAYDESLTGMEFASGIPGTIGGAIVMNAGAYGGEMTDIVNKVRIMFIEEGKADIKTVDVSGMEFGYRTSILKKKNGIVLDVKISLSKGNKEDIKSVMDDLNGKRREKQPLEYPSAGSTFKRPEGYFAAKLIEDSGLKGFKVGTAMVSDKHAGFVVNTGGAKAMEVRELMDKVTDKVKKDTGVTLEPEVIFLGEF